ncbi:MAG: GNAT family N-acetyltransferase [Spirochaetes bacterium]|nr:GNAT family N-acetyltransferase [Spirochaetota bacterium]
MAPIDFVIRDGFDSMDFDRVAEMLARSFWTPGISREEVIKGARHSALVVGAFLPNGTQVGYARAISDKTRFAYILDVFVDEPCRRSGIGQAMVRHILDHEEMKGVYQWILITRDAHGVYRKAGFTELANPDRWMQIMRERPKR